MYDAYLANNTFLADINNERPVKNSTYKRNMISLNAMLLVTAKKDMIVVPKESTRFSFFARGDRKLTDLVPYDQSDGYKGDWIGLRTLDEAGKLDFLEVPCSHQDVPRDVCKDSAYDAKARALFNNTLPARD